MLLYVVLYRVGSAFGWSMLMFVGQIGALINLYLAILNLIPIPPLDGSTVIRAAFPGTEPFFRALQGFPVFFLLILGMLIPPFAAVFILPVALYRDALAGVISSLHL